MKTGDTVYVRYIGNIPHWPQGLFAVSITSVGKTFIDVAVHGQLCRFNKTDLRHENRGHRPAYRLYPTAAAYTLETEREDLKKLMTSTDFVHLPLAKQRAIRAILQA
ncbi:hypothetical protein A6C57_27600 (plasmid) [Fibrella sp. ES10-3-2-2]